MSDSFALLDLHSQAVAVLRLLAGRSENEKLAWLATHGKLEALASGLDGGRTNYLFESVLGIRCLFFIDSDDSVFFLGDQQWSRVPARETR